MVKNRGLKLGIIIIFLICCLFGNLNVISSIVKAEKSNEDNLVAYWNFNDGNGDILFDQSKNQNHGKIYNATWDEGISGKTLNFSGGYDSYVSIPDSPSIRLYGSNFTIEVWIKINKYAEGETCEIISTRSGYYEGFGFGITGERSESNIDAGHLSFFEGVGDYIEFSGTHSSIIIPLNEWTYVVFTYDYSNTLSHFYINGKINTRSNFDFKNNYTNGLEISRDMFEKNSGFNGNIDEINIWKKTLSPQDILNNYYSIKPPIKNEYYMILGPFRDENNTDIKDVVINITIDGKRYSNTTEAYGYAIFQLPNKPNPGYYTAVASHDDFSDLKYSIKIEEDGRYDQGANIIYMKNESNGKKEIEDGKGFLPGFETTFILIGVILTIFLARKKKN